MNNPTKEQIDRGKKSFGLECISADDDNEIIEFLMSDHNTDTVIHKSASDINQHLIKGETDEEIIASITMCTPLINDDIPPGVYIDDYEKSLRGMQDHHKLVGLDK